MDLRVTTLLAENTEPIMSGLCERLAAATGVAVMFDPEMPHSERERAVIMGEIDLVWACGLLTVELIAGGLDLQIIAAPVFSGQTDAVYHSVLISRQGAGLESLTDAVAAHGRLAINDSGSWSGNHGFAAYLAQTGAALGDFGPAVETGSHLQSIRALQNGDADMAAIDHTVWEYALARRITSGVVELGQTNNWPAPPFSICRSMAPELRLEVERSLLAIEPGEIDRLSGVASATQADYRKFKRQS